MISFFKKTEKFSSTIEINNSIDDMNKLASCADYLNTSFQPKLGDSGHIWERERMRERDNHLWCKQENILIANFRSQ